MGRTAAAHHRSLDALAPLEPVEDALDPEGRPLVDAREAESMPAILLQEVRVGSTGRCGGSCEGASRGSA